MELSNLSYADDNDCYLLSANAAVMKTPQKWKLSEAVGLRLNVSCTKLK